MHHFYFLAIFPVTGLTVAGYLTQYCARKSEGRMRTAGKILSGWCFALAILVAAIAIIHPAVGDRRAGYFHEMGDDMGATPSQNAPADQSTAPQAPSTEMPASDSGASNGNGWKTN